MTTLESTWDGSVDVSVLRGKDDAPEQPARLLTRQQAAAYLRISTASLWRLTREGRIQAINIGALVRFDVRDLDTLIDQLRAEQHVAPEIAPKAAKFAAATAAAKRANERPNRRRAVASAAD